MYKHEDQGNYNALKTGSQFKIGSNVNLLKYVVFFVNMLNLLV